MDDVRFLDWCKKNMELENKVLSNEIFKALSSIDDADQRLIIANSCLNAAVKFALSVNRTLISKIEDNELKEEYEK